MERLRFFLNTLFGRACWLEVGVKLSWGLVGEYEWEGKAKMLKRCILAEHAALLVMTIISRYSIHTFFSCRQQLNNQIPTYDAH